MRKGVLQQEGAPQTLYDEPANLFVATFVGSPAMNLFRATVVAGDDGTPACRIGEQEVQLPPELAAAHSALARDLPIAVGVRPEDLVDPATADPSWSRLKGEVTMVETLGFERLVHVAIEAEPVVTEDVLEVARDTDEASVERLQGAAQSRRVVAVARFDGSAIVRPHSQQELAIRPHKMRLFDLQTGNAIH
jgi:multiple sugar transport system ATP-binding protein